jgi:hypothetical protein
MQMLSLSQIVWLQLLCIALYPIFFNPINVRNDLANVTIYDVGLLMISYLILRNFAFNDEKYKTKLLFSILPVSSTAIIRARAIIVYVFCFIATPLLILFSNIAHALKPKMFAVMQIHILPKGLLLFAVFMPIEFLIFYMFEAQKADIIGAIAIFPYMALMALLYHYVMNGFLWIAVFFIVIAMNVICYRLSNILYKRKIQI